MALPSAALVLIMRDEVEPEPHTEFFYGTHTKFLEIGLWLWLILNLSQSEASNVVVSSFIHSGDTTTQYGQIMLEEEQ